MANNVTYRIMMESDCEKVKQLLYESFFNDEPLGQSLKIKSPGESAVYVDAMVEYAGKCGVSIIAVNESGTIIGCRLSIVETPHSNFKIPISADNPNHNKIQFVVDYLKYLNEGINVFDLYGVDKIFHFQALNVHKDFGGRGIGKRLVEESVKLAKSKGIRLIMAEVSGKFSQRVYEKLEFDVLKEVKYAEYRNKKGEVVFNDTGIHTSGKLVAKLYNDD